MSEAKQDEIRRLKQINAQLSAQLTEALVGYERVTKELTSTKSCLLSMMHTRDRLAEAAGKFMEIVGNSYGQNLHGPYKQLDGPSPVKGK